MPICAPRYQTDRDGALRRVLAGLPRPKTDPVALGVRSTHPDPARRLAALDDTRPLFPLGAVVAFAAGLTATIAYDSVVQLLSIFVTDPFDLFFLAGLAFVPLAAGVVGVAIWREAFAAHADGRSRRRPGSTRSRSPPDSRSARSWRSTGSSRSQTRRRSCASSAASTGCSGLRCSSRGLVLLVAWIRTSASWWLRALGGRRPVLAQTAGLLVAGAALQHVHGRLLNVRDLRAAWRSRPRGFISCSISRSTHRCGRSRSTSGSSSWTASCS